MIKNNLLRCGAICNEVYSIAAISSGSIFYTGVQKVTKWRRGLESLFFKIKNIASLKLVLNAPPGANREYRLRDVADRCPRHADRFYNLLPQRCNGWRRNHIGNEDLRGKGRSVPLFSFPIET